MAGRQGRGVRAGTSLVIALVTLAVPAGAALATEPAQKILLDLRDVNEQGLRGPADGLRAVSYEYCIPDTDAAVRQVRSIDATLQVLGHSPGRAGCKRSELLCLGSTHQKNFRQVLQRLAALDYVREIREAFFE